MTAPKSATRPAGLPPVSVARLQAATSLIDGLIEEQASMFARRGGEYRNAWREGSERELAHDEVAQVAAAMGAALGRDDVPNLLAEVQMSDLRTRSDPPRHEVLLAAGAATAPAFIDACLKVVALLEMDTDTFEESSENGTLPAALDTAIRELRRLSIGDAKKRAADAFEHLYTEAGTSPGELLGLIAKALGTSLATAIGPLSEHASLIGSLARTGGDGESASTESPGEI